MRVLIIDGEASAARSLSLEMALEGYSAAIASTGAEGLEEALSGSHDAVLLEVALPDINGLEVLRLIRQSSNIPVILTANDPTVKDKVAGLDAGANDYVSKPILSEELFARLRAALRSAGIPVLPQQLSIKDVTLDHSTRTVTRSGRALSLTKKEFDLLECLMRNKNIVMTRGKLLDSVWGYDFLGDSNIVDVYVRYLRSKLNRGFEEDHIVTVRGVGYVFKDQ